MACELVRMNGDHTVKVGGQATTKKDNTSPATEMPAESDSKKQGKKRSLIIRLKIGQEVLPLIQSLTSRGETNDQNLTKKMKVGGQTTTKKDASAASEKPAVSDSKKQGKKKPGPKKRSAGVVPAIPMLNSPKKINEKNRDDIRERFAAGLLMVAKEVDDQKLKDAVSGCDPYVVAAKVETELFKVWGCFNGPKKHKYRSVMFNMQDGKNPDFRRKVLLGVLPPDSISTLNAEDMASDSRRLENQKIRERKIFDCELVQSAQASSLDIKCGKCKKSETVYHQMQTRRADEPMTTFVTCLNCSHHWKF